MKKIALLLLASTTLFSAISEERFCDPEAPNALQSCGCKRCWRERRLKELGLPSEVAPVVVETPHSEPVYFYPTYDGSSPCGSPCNAPCVTKSLDVAYTPAFYDLPCAWGIFLTADFLYWYARESNLPIALEFEGIPVVTGSPLSSTVFGPQTTNFFNTKWDFGFKAGIGSNWSCDGWDVYANWTYYHNKKKDTHSVPDTFAQPLSPDLPGVGQNALLNPWINASLVGTGTAPLGLLLTFDKIKANWSLNFNVLDLEIGRKFWLSPKFALRPYAGVRAGWTKTHFDTLSSRNFPGSATAFRINRNFKDRFRNNFWGVGLLAGIQPDWFFSRCFSLFANLDVSLIYGESRAKKRENYTDVLGLLTDVNFSNKYSTSFFMLQPILDLGLGLRWSRSYCRDRYRFSLDASWENHIWFDHDSRLKTFGPSFELVDSNLMLGGLTIGLKVDF